MFFNLFYLLLALLISPIYFYKRLRYGKYRESLPGMFGAQLKALNPDDFKGGSIWMHSVSVGETVAARAMLPFIKEQFPDKPLIISTTTETGQAQARKLFQDEEVTIIFYPLDLTFNVRRFQQFLNPHLFILLEAEIWPNFLQQCAQRNCPVVLLNGKLSARSARRYLKISGILRSAFGAIRLFCMQTPRDAEGIIAISQRPNDVHVTGNLKFDQLPEPLTDEERQNLARKICLPEDETDVIVVGSTHPGEETLTLEMLAAIRTAGLPTKLILCPRHPERFDEVAGLIDRFESPEGKKFSYIRSSQLEADSPNDEASESADIILLDVMGVLAQAYGLGKMAVLGGSFADIGGHNLLEPAAHGIPVLCGPNMYAQSSLVTLMQDGDAFFQTSKTQLADEVIDLLQDETKRQEWGERGREIAEKHRGAAARCSELIRLHIVDKMPGGGGGTD
jgi:3-deoxy-D-manno-octulosonic-acid transferase